MQTFTTEDVLKMAEAYNVKFIRLQFTDIFGVFKNIAVTVEELERALAGEIFFDSAVIQGSVNNKKSNIYLMPDPTTFQIFPWRPREGAVARLICDIYDQYKKPYPGCSRLALKAALQEANKKGLALSAGAEIDFFLFNLDEKGKPTPVNHDYAGYCDLTPLDLGENARRDMVLTLEEMGFRIVSSHHEVSPGQHQIFLKEDQALGMADKMATFKFVVRTIAQRHGLHASFMPKPFTEYNGSSMNLHLSLWQEENNAFFDKQEPLALSTQGGAFVAGILQHAGALAAIANPLVNSYKRFANRDIAPYLKAWSEENRNAAIYWPPQRGMESKLVMRQPDPAANPYLLLAAALHSGLEGMDKNLLPPSLLMTGDKEFSQRKALFLPQNLGDALTALQNDSLVAKALGEMIHSVYITGKSKEWQEFQDQVHPWEIKHYLTNY